jgi:CCR4-NOT transcriptional regulation complex NOT5 subunit
MMDIFKTLDFKGVHLQYEISDEHSSKILTTLLANIAYNNKHYSQLDSNENSRLIAKMAEEIIRLNNQWIKFPLQKPKDIKAYQVCFENRNGIQRTTKAQYIPANTIKAEDFFDEESLEEMDDPEIFVPEGWYEQLWTLNGTMIISETVTHYQPLPSLPNTDKELK